MSRGDQDMLDRESEAMQTVWSLYGAGEINMTADDIDRMSHGQACELLIGMGFKWDRVGVFWWREGDE
jgi:hypothetical protein